MRFAKRTSTLALTFAGVIAALGMISDASAQTGGGRTTGGTGFGTVGSTGGMASGTTGGASGTGTSTTGQNSGSTNAGRSASGSTAASGESIARDADRVLSDVGTATSGGAGAAGRGGLSGLGGLGGGGLGGLSAFGLNPFGSAASSAEAKPTIRTRLRSEVILPPQSPLATRVLVQERVSSGYGQSRFSGIGATFNGSTAIIGGTVANERDRRMAELLLRLEPGVGRVDNRIIVAP